MKHKKILLILPVLLIIAAISTNTCDDQTSDSNNGGEMLLTGTYQNQVPIINLENGKQLMGNDQIIAEFSRLSAENPNGTYTLNISGEEVPEIDSLSNGEFTPRGSVIHLPYNYNVVFAAHRGMVGGCINKDVYHVNFIINKTGVQKPITDLHVASWLQSGKACVGIYISPQGWCKKICTPSFNDLVGAIAGALIAAGLSVTIAYAIAYVLTPVAMGLLAL